MIPQPTRDPQPSAHFGTLLCVDDEINILNALRRLLRRSDYRILFSQSGAEAVEILERENIDLLLTDIRMPGMSGSELLNITAERWPEVFRIVLTGYADVDAAIAAINDGKVYRYLTKPWEDSDLLLTIAHAIEEKQLHDERRILRAKLSRRNMELAVLNNSLETQVKERTAELMRSNEELGEARDHLKRSYHHVIKTFAHLLRLREGRSDGHSVSVGKLAVSIGTQLGLEREALEQLYFGAILHDVGQSALPDALFKSPVSELTLSERAQAQQHCVLGAALFAGIDDLKGVAVIIRHHHETYDGKGYPDRLKGDAIPLGARIVAAASEYDRLVRGIAEQRRLDPVTAMTAIKGDAGSRFDPIITEMLSRIVTVENQARRERCLRSNELVVGMRLSRDLFGKEGMLLVPAEHLVTRTLLSTLQLFEKETSIRLQIYIYKE